MLKVNDSVVYIGEASDFVGKRGTVVALFGSKEQGSADVQFSHEAPGKLRRLYQMNLETPPAGIVPPAPQPTSALAVQISGSHYKSLKIQPIEYIHANGIPFAEGCVIKYVSRWREKGGLKDLEKAKHFLELLIELELKAGPQKAVPA